MTKIIDKLTKKISEDAGITEKQAYDALYSFCESANTFKLENDVDEIDIISDSTDDIIFMVDAGEDEV